MNALFFLAGLVVGVVYHAVLQPYVLRAWEWVKGVVSRPEG